MPFLSLIIIYYQSYKSIFRFLNFRISNIFFGFYSLLYLQIIDAVKSKSSLDSIFMDGLFDEQDLILCKDNASLNESMYNIFKYNNSNITESLKTTFDVEFIKLSFTKEFPISIIFTEDNSVKYELIFRFLLKLQFLITEISNLKLDMACAQYLKSRILFILRILLQYFYLDVIAVNTSNFFKKFNNDNITLLDFPNLSSLLLTSNLKGCFLMSEESIRACIILFDLSAKFLNIKEYHEAVKMKEKIKKLFQQVSKFEEYFKNLLAKIYNEQSDGAVLNCINYFQRNL